MKKIVIGILIAIVVIIGGFILWWNLPLTVKRRADIKLGEQIIKNIETYQKQNGLPDNDDWETFRELGFRDKIFFFQPEYTKLDDNNFELVFVEGFDGPYLMWTSTERQWKKGYPTFQQTTDNE